MAFGYDPQLSAYLRAMNADENVVRSQARQASNLAKRQTARQDPVFDRRIEREGRNIMSDQESRGFLNSGMTARRLTENRGDIELERAEVQAQLRDQLQGIQLDTAQRVAEIRRAAAEQNLAGRTRAAADAVAAQYGRGGSFF